MRLRSYSTSFCFLPAFAPPHGWVADPRSVNAPKSAPPYGRIYDRGKPGGSFCGIACGDLLQPFDHESCTNGTTTARRTRRKKSFELVFVVPVVPSW